MAITADGWFTWMARKPGPADKVYSAPCTSELYIPHSAVGNSVQGWYSRLFNPSRLPDGRYTPYAAASVTGWFFKEWGRPPEQYYPLTASCWASGTRDFNTRGNAFENAGGPPGNIHEPLTPWQIECNVRAMREIAEWKGRDPATYWKRPVSNGDPNATAYEHRESVWFGGSATGCPNSRIPWNTILERLQPEQEWDEMATKEELEEAFRNVIKDELTGLMRLMEASRGFVKGRGTPTVYHLSLVGNELRKRSVSDPATFAMLGGKFGQNGEWDNIIDVDPAHLNNIPEDPAIKTVTQPI